MEVTTNKIQAKGDYKSQRKGRIRGGRARASRGSEDSTRHAARDPVVSVLSTEATVDGSVTSLCMARHPYREPAALCLSAEAVEACSPALS